MQMPRRAVKPDVENHDPGIAIQWRHVKSKLGFPHGRQIQPGIIDRKWNGNVRKTEKEKMPVTAENVNSCAVTKLTAFDALGGNHNA